MNPYLQILSSYNWLLLFYLLIIAMFWNMAVWYVLPKYFKKSSENNDLFNLTWATVGFVLLTGVCMRGGLR